VVWTYPRGGGLSKEGETALDVIAYGAQIAALLGAHIIKVKMPTAHLELPESKKVYEEMRIPRATATERLRHVVQSALNGRRIVLFSGGPKESDEALFAEAQAIRDGGVFGSIVGRNSFQLEKAAALSLLDEMVRIYQGEAP
jgi:class I fructose-bisphosphate aldolase